MYFSIQVTCFIQTSRFIIQNIKKVCSQGLRFNKINTFCCIIKNTLSETGILLLQASQWRTRWLLVHLLPWSWFTQRCQQFHTPLLLHHQRKCQKYKRQRVLVTPEVPRPHFENRGSNPSQPSTQCKRTRSERRKTDL